jgi:alpha-methylacyl-CoA racemase
MDHLAGTKVLDLTRLTPGAYATKQLADLGAEVVKVEEPIAGDYMRELVPGGFEALNRGKLSIALNLKDPKGTEVLLRLLDTSDVLLESFRPGVMARLGLDYATLAERFPRLIYCSLSGYGQTGPYSRVSGHDINYQGVTGMSDLLSDPSGTARPTGIALGDYFASQVVSMSVIAALLRRTRSGVGEHLDVSMTDVLVSIVSRYVAEHDDRPGVPAHAMLDRAGYGIFTTADRRRLSVGCIEDVFWHRLLDAIDSDSLSQYRDRAQAGADPRVINDMISTVISSRSAEHWLELAQAEDIPITLLNELSDVSRDAHIRARELFRPSADGSGDVRFPTVFSSSSDDQVRERAPRIGEHTPEILRRLGCTGADLDALFSAEIVR